MNFPTIILSTYLISMILLTSPILFFWSPTFHLKTKLLMKLAFFTSTAPLLMFLNENLQSASFSWKWINILSSSINFSIQLDHLTIFFTPVALMISWCIIDYSLWYMKDDPKMLLFFKYLIIFILMMMILISANNLIMLFIGWEGVGIMSYLLIGWYFTRSGAGTAALQAILYNRVGDIGFIFSIMSMIIFCKTTEMDFIFQSHMNTPIILAMIIAAASKSAQFSFHPWLISAMEGPTPVSALLHSSTMVVAGVFLLIRIYPLIKSNPTTLTACLCLGAISTAFASACALTQNDIKKIIAYSTSSQLGLMIMAIGLNLPHLALFHICTHAFFKAMLFLCSGLLIHNLNNEQDIRKMGGLQKSFPITTSCTSIGSLALMGTPYLAGFYSKDAIIEAINISYINTSALILAMIAVSFSTIYSIRIIYFAVLKYPRTTNYCMMETSSPTTPLKRLAFNSIILGSLMFQIILPTSPLVLTMPTWMKSLATFTSLLGLIIALDLASNSWTKPPSLLNPSNFLNTSIYPLILHRLLPTSTLNFSLQISSHLIDTLWLEKIGPAGLANLQLPFINKNQLTLKGQIKTYISTLTLTSLITLIMVNQMYF